jgi:probable HAF family extracellular repeat protein
MEDFLMTASRVVHLCTIMAISALLASCGGSTVNQQLPAAPAAQQPSHALAVHSEPDSHRRPLPGYTFYDLGTLGGPQSDMSGDSTILNNSNQAAGLTDTSASNPFYPNFNPLLQFADDPYGDPHLFHAFAWSAGGLTDLGSLPGTNDSVAVSAGPAGGATGDSENGQIDPLMGWPEARAVLWSSGTITDLGTLGGYESLAGEMNARGQVTGAAANAIPDQYSFFGWGTQTRGFIWEKATGMRDIGTLGGPDTIASFINERGQISGDSYTNAMAVDPFIWDHNKMTDIGSLGGVSGSAWGLNASGDVSGMSDLAGDHAFHPFLWQHGTLIDLGTLGGDLGNGAWLNNAAQVAGWAYTKGNNAFHAFRWTKGVMTDLGTLPGDQCSNANGINARGDIVGASSSCGYGASAYLWRNGTMIDLNQYVPPSSALHLSESLYINDNGAIAGHGVLPNGDLHAFILLPNGSPMLAERHISYHLTAPAKHPTLREMLTYLLARDARMKHMVFLNREIDYITGRVPRASAF